MLAQTLDPNGDPCDLADKWRIHHQLALKLIALAGALPFGLQIISGFRTAEQQQELIAAGRGAALDRSTHTSCPATGADVWPLVAVAPQIQIEFGRVARLVGLRWGGGSAVNPDTGIPSDWNHVDLGPRAP